ncbi:MAG: hypothetical protein LH474_02055 [Chamaesiphon sp.]|nr:hypothetical protein [Chamaesiphon sp.]
MTRFWVPLLLKPPDRLEFDLIVWSYLLMKDPTSKQEIGTPAHPSDDRSASPTVD